MRRPPLGRLAALLGVLGLGLAGILVRLTFLQVRDAQAFQSLARNQRLRVISLPADRGSMLDRGGEVLALSLPAKDVYADPRYVTDPAGTAARLAPILKVPAPRLQALLEESGSFVYLARQVDLGPAARIERMHLAGIDFLDDSKRYYPNGVLAPQVLGFVGIDGTGLAGLELQYQNELAGHAGEHTVEVDPSGHLIPQGVNQDRPPITGDSVVTTLDRDIQYRAQIALRRTVKRNHARGGSVIVMNPRTGSILAMATWPWFDPAVFSSAPEDRIRNEPVTDSYEPGSVMKVVTASAAVEEHVLPLTKRLLVADSWPVGGHVFHDAHTHPTERMTLADIIAQSSNVGTIRVAGMLGPSRLARYIAQFGLGQTTGVGFPGESPGIVPPLYLWSGTSMGTLPVGQGLAATALQVASAYSAIANKGVWVQPRLVRGFLDPQGAFHRAQPSFTRRVVSARTARIVAQMLAFVVDVGTGTPAQIPHYWVAGKTGTAMIPKGNGQGYTHRYIASFVGFAPASDPQVLVEAVIDQPVTEYGAIAAAPLFHEVARYALAHLGVPPGRRLPLPPHVVGYP